MPTKTKQSEAQKIPKLRFSGFWGVWENKKIGKVGKITTGNTPPTANRRFYDGDFLFVSPADINNSHYVVNTKTKLSQSGFDCCRKIRKGAVLFVCIGSTIGKIAQSNGECATNQQINAIESSESNFDDFIYFRLLVDAKKIKMLAGTQAVPQINKTDFSNIKTFFPSLPEQQKIANFLGVVDEWIENLRAQKEAFMLYKKGVMQKIFSREVRFGDADWEERRLGDIFENTRGHVLAMSMVSKEKTGKYKYPVYSSQTTNDGLSGYYKDYLFEDCITWTTDGANAGDVKFRSGKFYCTNVCGVLKSDRGYANLCVAEIFNSIARKYVSYVGNPKLMNNVVSIIKVFIPKSVTEQQKIAEFLTSIDNLIESKQQQIAQAEEWKRGLMQGLFV